MVLWCVGQHDHKSNWCLSVLNFLRFYQCIDESLFWVFFPSCTGFRCMTGTWPPTISWVRPTSPWVTWNWTGERERESAEGGAYLSELYKLLLNVALSTTHNCFHMFILMPRVMKWTVWDCLALSSEYICIFQNSYLLQYKRSLSASLLCTLLRAGRLKEVLILYIEDGHLKFLCVGWEWCCITKELYGVMLHI